MADVAARGPKPKTEQRFRASYPEVLVWPPKPAGIARWLFGFPGFLWPWNVLYLAVTALVWWVATPQIADMADWSPGWVLAVYARNLALTIGWFGALHVLMYRRRPADTSGKFSQRWPGQGTGFTFGTQLRDNVFWTIASGVTIWTAWECVTWWLAANGRIPLMTFAEHPVWFVALFFLIPLVRDLHFYAVHRGIHWPPLYRVAHSLHHRNTNPSPWSGLSMHPIEHVLYFSGVAFHWLVLSHPIHALFHLVHLGWSPGPGHLGFERLELIDGKGVETGGFAHYLHHKYFEVNYADGVFPLDRWFGSFHDGSPEADERMKQRRRARAALAREAAAVAE